MINQTLAISLGAILGANARYWIGVWAKELLSISFPLGTFIVNVLGSFLLGFLVALSLKRGDLSQTTLLLLGTGFMGSFTTFSTFSVETVQLISNGDWQLAFFNLVGSIALGLGGVWLGTQVVRVM